ncbi:MAG TPA: H-X9-DG-CTERM domain-containing protein [Isosphaeraceae bacterium]|nr:H-X9-DG-CTERM domain-containing protein [Isosphaeraceae bacterium]
MPADSCKDPYHCRGRDGGFIAPCAGRPWKYSLRRDQPRTFSLACLSGGLNGNDKYYAPRSRHPGGVNVAMCDGSVRFFKNSVNIFIWRGVTTANGGEVISADSY